MIPEEGLACAREVEDDLDRLCGDLLLVGYFLLSVELELPEPGEVASVGVKDEGLGCQYFSCVIIVNHSTVLVEYRSVSSVRQLWHTD